MTERDIVVTLTSEPEQGSEVSIFFPIEFALNSADLNQGAVTNLAKIGVALQSPELRNLTVLVEGHTDASGAAAYNQKLSERRAKSAAEFLSSLGVEASRLKVVGRGELDPIENVNPYAARQRRVEIVRVF
nr:OmpA family protein [uncultured Roseibium sp.]